MIDTDQFSQFFVVPDDRPTLPPVDDVFGLKDLSSFGFQYGLQIDEDKEPSGLLLGSDSCDSTYRDIHASDVISMAPNAGENAIFLICEQPSPSYTSLFPPPLSPDSSPSSIASSPWLRTPGTGPVAAPDTLWDIEEESCSIVHFLDQSGNNLEDLPCQVSEVMPEDIACTPHFVPNTSLPITTSHTALSETPVFAVSPSLLSSAPTLSCSDTGPFEQAYHASPFSASQTLDSLFGFPPVTQEPPLPACSLSPSLSPLTTVSFRSRSPSTSPNSSPFTNDSLLPPVPLPFPLSSSGENIGRTGAASPEPTKVNSVKLPAKRNADDLDGDAPPSKVSRRLKATNVDEEEWSPDVERVKRLRGSSSLQTIKQAPTIPRVGGADHTTSQGSERNIDATPSTCHICGQGFTRTSDYVRHIENSASHPETRKVWPCPYCSSALGRKDALGRHIRTLHPGKSAFPLDGVPGSQLPGSQRELSVQRMGQRKLPLKRQSRRRTARRNY